MLPYLFLLLGLINDGPKFYAKTVDFDVGSADVFVETKLIFVTTLQLTCVFRICCGFVATYLTLILLSLCRDKVYECHDKVYECRDISETSMS